MPTAVKCALLAGGSWAVVATVRSPVIAIPTQMCLMVLSLKTHSFFATNYALGQEYEGKLADLEKERETIEEEKAQVDRYKQLLLKQ